MALGNLFGRETELTVIDTFLERAGTESPALVIEGEPGIGKTSLWREALARAERLGIRTLACRGAEAEAKLSFSALSDLLDRVSDESFAALPDPQRRALEVALLRVDPHRAPPDPRAAATAFRSLLGELAATSPTLVAVDDTQWLDISSAKAIDFALRRVGGMRVSLLASRRPGLRTGRSNLANALSEATILELEPLSLAATHELLKDRLGRSLPRPLLVRVHETARGNPFFALEIAQVVIETETGPAEPLPVPQDRSELVLRRVRRLRATTREALLVVAVAAQPTEVLVTRMIGGDTGSALDEAEDAGLLEQRDGALFFTHPLYAAAVYSSATRQRRRRTHQQLAGIVDEPEERSRHLALAAEGPDETVASSLDRAASAAKARGAMDAASELAELAVRLTPDELGENAGERRLELGVLLRLTGDTERAQRVLEDLAERTSGSLRARSLFELAAVRYWTEGALAGVECSERALQASRGDIAFEAKAHADLAVYCDFDLERSYRHAQTALRLFDQTDEPDPLEHSEALAIAARGSLMLGRGLPVADIDRAIELESQASEAGASVAGRIPAFSGQWLKYVDDFEGARARLEDARREAIEEGDESALPNILAHLAQTELWSGKWALAASYADESCAIAEQLGQTFGGPTAYRALVDAHLDRVERARSTALEGLEVVKRNPLAAPLYLRALGFLELSLGELGAAADYLTRALRHAEEVRILEPGVLRIHADAVEALVAVGDLDRAKDVLLPWERQARRIDLAWSLATSSRCRGLLESARGRTDRALESIEQALVHHERLPMPFELGRTLLVKGQIERRAKRKAAARSSLERALGVFEQLPAPLWAKRAHSELRRLGLRRGDRDALTESEQRVAALAASGLRNREVAAQLYMSPKTVEANLARVYRKLGIHSRAELGAWLAREGTSGQERRETPDSSPGSRS